MLWNYVVPRLPDPFSPESRAVNLDCTPHEKLMNSGHGSVSVGPPFRFRMPRASRVSKDHMSSSSSPVFPSTVQKHFTVTCVERLWSPTCSPLYSGLLECCRQTICVSPTSRSTTESPSNYDDEIHSDAFPLPSMLGSHLLACIRPLQFNAHIFRIVGCCDSSSAPTQASLFAFFCGATRCSRSSPNRSGAGPRISWPGGRCVQHASYTVFTA
ncbi:hypothetical protein DFH07DRAFT_801735 [Mycena maculata]|uniref:Uncharacterized protein n=1 Tax=Mycena maculata TaxID=230809 RepID=A0AAD7JY69_9AGAR|nr:hypothetical protein DFH07DRAFT_801735 [Mycena maculata]